MTAPSCLMKPSLSAPSAGGLFFPQRVQLGLDARDVTPELNRAVVQLAAEVRSFERASMTTRRVLRIDVSDSTIRRLVGQVGGELAGLEELDGRCDGKEAVVPEIAVASCDGGRLRTREPGHGRGVTLCGDTGWKETKNASFEKMTLHVDHQPGVDPCPELPTSFRCAKNVAGIAEKPVPDVTGDAAVESSRVIHKGPQRVLRTVLSSLVSSDEFGPQMQREASRRRFYESPLRAFIGDGLNWNWSIWKRYFPTFIPILDFIHAIQYLYQSALAVSNDDASAWALYVEHVTWCWSGRIDDVIADLERRCTDAGNPDFTELSDDHPLKPVGDAIRYFRNNRERMDYPTYRRQGLPVTSAPMESLIKQINARVKGTEMFWDNPTGAEAILHVRAAALCDDGRLDNYLECRPGHPFVRRATIAA